MVLRQRMLIWFRCNVKTKTFHRHKVENSLKLINTRCLHAACSSPFILLVCHKSGFVPIFARLTVHGLDKIDVNAKIIILPARAGVQVEPKSIPLKHIHCRRRIATVVERPSGVRRCPHVPSPESGVRTFDGWAGALASHDGSGTSSLASADLVGSFWLESFDYSPPAAGGCALNLSGTESHSVVRRCSAGSTRCVGRSETPSTTSSDQHLIPRRRSCLNPLCLLTSAADKKTSLQNLLWNEIKEERRNRLMQTSEQVHIKLLLSCCHNYKRIVIIKITRTESYAVR